MKEIIKDLCAKMQVNNQVQPRKALSLTEDPTVGTGVEAEMKISPLSEI